MRTTTTRTIAALVAVVALLATHATSQDEHAHDHPAVAAGSEILPPLGDHGWHHQIVEISVTDEGFTPSAITVRRGDPLVVVFANTMAVEHHFHIMGLEPADLSWFMVTENALDDYDPSVLFTAERAKDHICDSVTGICRLGINVHLHADPGSFDAVMFTAPVAGTFTIECPLHAEMHATIVVAER